MSNTIPFVFSGNVITVFPSGVPHQVDATHPNFNTLRGMVLTGPLTDEDEVRRLAAPAEEIVAKLANVKHFGRVTVGYDAIMLDGKVIHSYLADCILNLAGRGEDVTPYANFMNKLYENPSQTAIDELFLWLEAAKMPITPEGTFLAYKKVREDFTSFADSSFKNEVGTYVEMDRNKVDPDRYRTCSAGLHFCSQSYLPQFHSGGIVVVVEINPADVVAISADYNNAKGRAWRYFIHSVIEEQHTKTAFDDARVIETAPITERGIWPTLKSWLLKLKG